MALPSLHGITGGIDKVGVVTLEFPTWVKTLGLALQRAGSISVDLAPEALRQLGLRVVGRRISHSPEGGFDVVFQIEGGAFDDDKPAKDDPERSTFAISGTMSEDPIQSHPNAEKINKVYGWNSETKEFPETIPDPKTTAAAGFAGPGKTTASKQVRNPLGGVSSYRSVGMVLKITTSAKTMPSDVFDHIGEIFDLSNYKLPGGFLLPKLGKNRNWLRLAPEVNSRGGVLEIVESYELSGPNGWIREIYDRDQLAA